MVVEVLGGVEWVHNVLDLDWAAAAHLILFTVTLGRWAMVLYMATSWFAVNG